jgi:two-component system, chemotaxis family, protein-glutamate methylesterase/glutaminase
MTRVLVVEDSKTARDLLVHILESDPEVRVIGTAEDGIEAIEAISRDLPDVVTMDVHMPRLDGIEATRRIMATRPVPIVIVSASWNPDDLSTTFEAIEAGAVALAEKPRGSDTPATSRIARELVQTVKAMAEVRVVRRWATKVPSAAPAAPPKRRGLKRGSADTLVVAIGVSTGGPPVLQTIFKRLPADFSAAILVVQHIAAGFLPGMARWLQETSGFPLGIAQHGDLAMPGRAYLGPDDRHLGIDAANRIIVSNEPPEHGLRPAVSYLFRSVAATRGAMSIGVLLTGMGRDGAAELKLLRDRGAITIAQDGATCVVDGMPAEAIRLGGAMHVLPPEGIASMLTSLVQGAQT